MIRPTEKKDKEPETHKPPIEEIEDRMVDYLWHGEVDGDVFDGDPADLPFF